MQLVLFFTFCVVRRCLPLQLIWFTGEWRLLFTLSARVTCMSSHRTLPLACMLTVYGLLHISYSLVRSLERVCLRVLVIVFVRSFVRFVTLRYVRSFVRSVVCSFGQLVGRFSFVRCVRSACRSFVGYARSGVSSGSWLLIRLVVSSVYRLFLCLVYRLLATPTSYNETASFFLLSRSSPLVEEFTSRFPMMSLLNVLSEFSLPTPLSEHNNALGLPQHQVHSPVVLVEFY